MRPSTMLRIGGFIVLSAAIPMLVQAQARWSLVENLRIGSSDEGPAQFADVRGLAVNARGELFVLEHRAQEIRMFDAKGQFLKRVARAGSGPGEIRNANGILVAPSGELWVNDPANARFSVFSSDGEFLKQHVVGVWGFSGFWDAMIARDGMLYEMILDRRGGPGRSVNAIRRFRADGTLMDTLPMPECASRTGPGRVPIFQGRGRNGGEVMVSVPFLPSPRRTWDTRGFIWCSPQDPYEAMQIRLSRGDTVLQVRRDVGRVTISREEYDTALERIRKLFAGGANEPDYSLIPRVKPPIENLDVDDRGRLWVRRAATDTTRTHFDVWNEEGRLVASVEAPFRLAPEWHPVFRGDTLYAVVRDEDDVPYVIRAVLRTSR